MASQTQIKIVLLGDQAVGKTSLLQKWVVGNYDVNLPPTVGGATQIRQDVVNGVKYSFQIWDTAGAERYRALTPLYTRDAAAAMIVFDMTSQTSVDNVKSWVEFVHQHGSMPFIIVGNKEDLQEDHIITSEEALELAFSVQSQFFATSAKTGNNVDLAFRQLEVIAVEYYTKSGTGGTDTVVIDPDVEQPRGGCSC